MTRLIYRPLGPWTEPARKPVPHSFSASWTDTLALLKTEVAMISGPYPECVIEVDVRESDIRADGFMRADRKPASNRVRVSFDSVHGPLSYPCATFEGNWQQPGWQANVRAVALGLHDLRRLERYGIADRGQQYTGWQALPPARPMGAAMTAEEAARFMEESAGIREGALSAHLHEPGRDARVMIAWRRASKRLHPDAGGDADDFRKLTAARDLLTGAHV